MVTAKILFEANFQYFSLFYKEKLLNIDRKYISYEAELLISVNCFEEYILLVFCQRYKKKYGALIMGCTIILRRGVSQFFKSEKMIPL